MMLLKRLSVFICPILIFSLLKLLLGFDDLKYIIILFIITATVLIVFLKYLIREKFFSSNFFYLSILPFLHLILVGFFLLILGSATLRTTVIIVSSLIIYLYLENIFLFYYHPAKYYPNALENLSSFLNIVNFFLLAIDLNAINIFLNMPLWALSLILIAFLSLMQLQCFWINKIKTNLLLVYILIINLIILEIFWSLSFLPANFFINGIILTILFYFIWGILKANVSEKLDRKIFWRYVVISTFLLLLVVFTNSWT